MDPGTLLLQWESLGSSLHLQGKDWTREGKRLLRSWARWPRRYHDLTHLAACLRHAGDIRSELDDSAAVLLALWFHDAIYWPWSSRNEERSAEWAAQFLNKSGLGPERTARIVRHVLATRDHQPGDDADTAWLLDIDLAVLGQDAVVYRAFEQGVRHEYRWVRWKSYVVGRSAVLRGFLNRPRIYLNDRFFSRYEARARTNVQVALDALQQGRLY